MSQDDEGNASRGLLGCEHFLAGLSPTYWSHPRVNIADILCMKIVDGMNCIIPCCDGRTQQTGQHTFYPVSKCMLIGMIVYAESKSSNSSFYVLDDGTGLMDCVSWSDNEGIYSLPPLADAEDGDSAFIYRQQQFAVGDMVRVYGRIECVSVSETKRDLQLQGKILGIRDCISEIHVRMMEKVTPPSTNVNDLDVEANHWLKSIRELKPATKRHPEGGLRNGIDVLNWLGPKIKSDVENQRNFPSADDTLGAWRVFGVSCHCQLSYKDALLYCHCQAKPEQLDPNFTYRDNLLSTLVDMERKHLQEISGNRGESKAASSGHHQGRDLRFQFRTVANEKHLCTVATQVAAQMGYPASNAQRVVVATFRALRHDGIIHLLDEESDTYLLVSKENVIEPYVRRSLSRKQRSLPIYLRNVPYARLQYVKRCISQEMKSM